MGLWGWLNRALNTGTHGMSWREPYLLWRSLRGDGLSWLLLAVATLIAVVSLPFLLQMQEPTAWGVGLLFGIPAAGLVVFWHDRKRSFVAVTEQSIRREWSRHTFHWLIFESQTWAYADIRRCAIVPREKSGKRFSVLILATDNDVTTIGLPRWLDLQQLGQYLGARDCQVVYLSSIPKAAFSPGYLPRPLPPLALALAVVLGVAGPVAHSNLFKSRGQENRAAPAAVNPDPFAHAPRPMPPLWQPGQEALRNAGQPSGSDDASGKPLLKPAQAGMEPWAAGLPTPMPPPFGPPTPGRAAPRPFGTPPSGPRSNVGP